MGLMTWRLALWSSTAPEAVLRDPRALMTLAATRVTRTLTPQEQSAYLR
jgi:hypothetical protein